MHVKIVVAIIAHEDQSVLPCTAILVFHIADNLINHHFGLGFCLHRKTPHGDILLIREIRIQTFSVVQSAKEAIVYIAMKGVKRIFTFKTKQVIVRIEIATVGRQHSVVPDTIAKQQQIFRHVSICLCPIVQHLEVPTVGICVRSATRELVVKFISRHDAYSHTIVLFVECLQTFGLRAKFLTGRNDDDHVGEAISMQVLVCNVVNIFRDREGGSFELWCRQRLLPCKRNII